VADQGFWNRAGRRSGGYRKTAIHVPHLKQGEQFYQCPTCSNDQLPLLVTSGCVDCRRIVELHNAQRLPGQKNYVAPDGKGGSGEG
jgi:hypothetical protein